MFAETKSHLKLLNLQIKLLKCFKNYSIYNMRIIGNIAMKYSIIWDDFWSVANVYIYCPISVTLQCSIFN